MANRFGNRPASTAKLQCLGLLLCLASTKLHAEIFNDLLIVLEPDGQHYVAQQTLATDGNLVVAGLPAARIPLETRFAGPERLTFASAHERNPDQLSLWSGSVMTRYRHYYGDIRNKSDTGVYELNTAAEHADFRIDEPGDVQWSLTWILPDNARVTNFHVIPASQSARTSPGLQGNNPLGRWQISGQVLTFRQSGGLFPALSIRFSLDNTERMVVDSCTRGADRDDPCAPDIDGDNVPDARDICLPPTSDVAALAPPPAVAPQVPDDLQKLHSSDELGCAHENPLLLAGLNFQSGQSYLDVASRNVLDRVARALQSMPDQVFEISAHTDNAGRVENNLRLSEDRARVVRHYLLLRGVPTRQLKARGYGESMPAYDNGKAIGRRANRRIELRRLN